MNQEDIFELKLLYLGRDIEYMSKRIQKKVNKCLENLEHTHDTKKYCDKLADVLIQFFEYSILYAKDLETRINEYDKKEEYIEIANRLGKHRARILDKVTEAVKTQSAEASNSSDPLGDVSVEDKKSDPVGTNSEILSQCSSIHLDAAHGIEDDDKVPENIVDTVHQIKTEESSATNDLANGTSNTPQQSEKENKNVPSAVTQEVEHTTLQENEGYRVENQSSTINKDTGDIKSPSRDDDTNVDCESEQETVLNSPHTTGQSPCSEDDNFDTETIVAQSPPKICDTTLESDLDTVLNSPQHVQEESFCGSCFDIQSDIESTINEDVNSDETIVTSTPANEIKNNEISSVDCTQTSHVFDFINDDHNYSQLEMNLPGQDREKTVEVEEAESCNADLADSDDLTQISETCQNTDNNAIINNTSDELSLESLVFDFEVNENVEEYLSDSNREVLGEKTTEEKNEAETSSTNAGSEQAKNRNDLSDNDRKSMLKLIAEYFSKKKKQNKEEILKNPSANKPGAPARKLRRKSSGPLKKQKSSATIDTSTSSEDENALDRCAGNTSKILESDGLSSGPSEKDQEPSQIVSPFKKKSVRPLPSSQSDDSAPNASQGSCIVSPFKKKGVKRLRSSDDSDLDQRERTPALQPNLGTLDNSKRIKLVESDLETQKSDKNPDTISSQSDGNFTDSTGNGDFQLDSQARDELLELLSKHDYNTEKNSCTSNKDVDDGFRLNDKGRDHLLALLSRDKNDSSQDDDDDDVDTKTQNGDTVIEDAVEEAPSSDHEETAPSSDREETAPSSDREETAMEDGNTSGDKDPRQISPVGASADLRLDLNDVDRKELLNLLSDYMKSREVVSGDLEGGDDDTKMEGTKDASKAIDQDMLTDLLNEYKNIVANKDDVNVEIDMVKEILEDADKNCSLEDGDSDSVILDVLREETIEETHNTSKRKRGKPKSLSKESWAAYKQLMEESDISSDISPHATDIDIDNMDIDDLVMGDSGNERTDRERRLHEEEKIRFNIDKELMVNVERFDFSAFDLSTVENEHPMARSKIDRLCDLSTILQKHKPSRRKRTSKKKSRYSSSSSSSVSDSSDVIASDSDLLSEEELADSVHASRSSSPFFSENAEADQDKLAHALFDNIRNSSEEDLSGYSSDSDASDDEETGKKKKKKSEDDEKKSEGDEKKNEEESEHDDRDEIKSSSDGGEQEAKVKEADLDSSDEEDFVGVRKGRAGWKQDPLLRGCLTSDDSSDSETERKKRSARIKKRLEMALSKNDSDDPSDNGREATIAAAKKKDCLSDSDVEFVMEKKATPKKADIVKIEDDENDDDDSPTKRGKGRRNIRALVQDDELEEATQKANREENERIRRLQEREKVKESFNKSQSFVSQPSDDDHDPLVLDVGEDVQIAVHPKITKKLKPHQRAGIQFMWDSCYESLEQLKEGYEGSGCILAHCMGLGKTLQALALIQTLFNYKETKTKHVLVVCPLSTVSNWRNEFKLAYGTIKNFKVLLYMIGDKKAAGKRFQIVNKWRKTGGMLVMGYECFGILINDQKLEKWEQQSLCRKEDILEALVDPGPDLVICDEGHLLRNKETQRNLALNRVKTKRRIVLTGTPLQNNLIEYYYMVHFVKPNLLGTEKEFKTNFVNPISNGQFEDSTATDILFMKKRTHVLHKILNKTVQRVEDTELKRYLPELVDQALFVKLSDLQVRFYNTYLDTANARPVVYTAAGNISRKNFLADIQILRYICTHPDVVTVAKKSAKTRIKEQDVIDDNLDESVGDGVISNGDWYLNLLPETGVKRPELGTKMMIALGIVREAGANNDKVLIFSQTHAEMDSLEYFLKQELNYKKGVDYNRMDGTINPEVRTHMCETFNDKNNNRMKVFIISTKVGGLGLNMTAANRVILMNVNWNPSYDTQSVFRAFRFGQNKAVYVYRLIAMDTMEEKMYQRQVTKLAVAHRVVDKHQITRHYSAADIQEFYSVRPSVEGERPVPNVPDDRILAKLVQKYPFLYKWHEHQALLANRPEEDLNEQQKNAAWEEFNRRATDPPLPPTTNVSHIPPGPSGFPNFTNLQPDTNYPNGFRRRKFWREKFTPNIFRPPADLYGAISSDSTDDADDIQEVNSSIGTQTAPGASTSRHHQATASKEKPSWSQDSDNGCFSRGHFADHNYSLPKYNTPVVKNGNSTQITGSSQPKYIRPVFVDVANLNCPKPAEKPNPNCPKPAEKTNPKPAEKPNPNCPKPAEKPNPTGSEGKAVSGNPQSIPVLLGGGVTISTTKIAPSWMAVNSQKPSISIIPHVSTADKPSSSISAKQTDQDVNGPMKQTKKADKSTKTVKKVAGQHAVKTTKSTPKNVLLPSAPGIDGPKPPQMNVTLPSTPGFDVPKLPQTRVVVTTAPGPDMPSLRILNVPPLVSMTQSPIGPVSISSLLASPSSAVQQASSSTTTTTSQSPLQKQMRDYMEHLHRLQQEAKTSSGPVAATLTTPGSKNGAELVGSKSGLNIYSVFSKSNGNNSYITSPILGVSKEAPDPVKRWKARSDLSAARNLSNIPKTYQKSRNHRMIVYVFENVKRHKTWSITMVGCSALGCKNRSEQGFLMKVFPRDPERRKQWAAKVKRDNLIPTNNSYICEVHFEPEIWEKTREDGTKKLNRNAVLTIFSFTKLKPIRKPTAERKSPSQTRVVPSPSSSPKKPPAYQKVVRRSPISSVATVPAAINSTTASNSLPALVPITRPTQASKTFRRPVASTRPPQTSGQQKNAGSSSTARSAAKVSFPVNTKKIDKIAGSSNTAGSAAKVSFPVNTKKIDKIKSARTNNSKRVVVNPLAAKKNASPGNSHRVKVIPVSPEKKKIARNLTSDSSPDFKAILVDEWKKKIGVNIMKSSRAAATATAQLPRVRPQDSFANGSNATKTHQDKKNNQPIRTRSLPSLSQTQNHTSSDISKSNKENKSLKRLSLRTSAINVSSIDRSNNKKHQKGSPVKLSNDVIVDLKKKGVSINYARRENKK